MNEMEEEGGVAYMNEALLWTLTTRSFAGSFLRETEGRVKYGKYTSIRSCSRTRFILISKHPSGVEVFIRMRISEVSRPIARARAELKHLSKTKRKKGNAQKSRRY